jgi:exosortase
MDSGRIFETPRVWLPGGLVLAAGAALSGGAAVMNGSLTMTAIGLAVQWVGIFVTVYGPAAARAASFPLCYLVFLAPFPEALLAGATSVLKNGSTEVVAALFSLTGTPVHRQDYVFTLASFSIEIADECSGIRSSIALMMTSLLAGHMFLRTTSAKLLLLVAILPITIVKNGIRIVGLSLLAIHIDPSFLVGRLHNDGGIVFFLLALAMLAPVLAIARRFETTSRRSDARVSGVSVSAS